MQPEGGDAEDQRGDQGHRVGLEQVGGHPGAVADVVADVVRDRGGVARVVLRDALLHLADQVGADVRRLGEDAAADAHEHGEQGGAEAEALEDLRRGTGVGQHDGRGPEQTEPDGEHADQAAGAEPDPHGLLSAAGLFPGGRRDPHVGPGGQPHAEVADGRREHRADHEERRAADPLGPVRRRQCEQQQEDDHHEHAERAELPVQVGGRTFLHRLADLLHPLCALAGGQHLAHQEVSDDERGDGHRGDHPDDRSVTHGELEALREELPGHPSSWFHCEPGARRETSGVDQTGWRVAGECKGVIRRTVDAGSPPWLVAKVTIRSRRKPDCDSGLVRCASRPTGQFPRRGMPWLRRPVLTLSRRRDRARVDRWACRRPPCRRWAAGEPDRWSFPIRLRAPAAPAERSGWPGRCGAAPADSPRTSGSAAVRPRPGAGSG